MKRFDPKVRAAALDFIKSYSKRAHIAHEAENRICFHLLGMADSELEEYGKFVTWLNNSEMWKTDLTVDELYDVYYEQKQFAKANP